jgi:hypothetical protein
VGSFPLNSTTPLTPEQQAAFIASIPPGLPRPECCAAAVAFISPPAACQCDSALLSLLPPTVATPEGVKGLTAVLGEKCGTPVTPCA